MQIPWPATVVNPYGCHGFLFQVAEDNYQALQSFFAKFPAFRNNDFYVFGESYGGIYVPTLSAKIVKGSANFNFKVSGLEAEQQC